MNNKISQSELITAMRLPLLYCIILIHTHYNKSGVPDVADTSAYIHYFITEWLSKYALYATLVCYFVFSAYYIYAKVPEKGWNLDFYYTTLAKRIPTLLIPFLLWGGLYIGAVWLKNGTAEMLGFATDERSELLLKPIESLIWSSANAPLWYVRDLMCMCLISPLFYYLFKYIKGWGVVLLALFFASGIQLGVLGFSSMAIASFGLGAYLGMNKLDIPTICWKLRYVSLLITLLIPTVATLGLYDQKIVDGAMNIYFLFGGSITLVNVFNLLFCRYAKIKDFCISLAPAAFFIYACNEIYILNWVKGVFARLPFSDLLGVRLFSYFMIPAVTILACYVLYRLCVRYIPRAVVVLSGGRGA